MCKRSNRGFVTVVYVKEAVTDQNHLLAKFYFPSFLIFCTTLKLKQILKILTMLKMAQGTEE